MEKTTAAGAVSYTKSESSNGKKKLWDFSMNSTSKSSRNYIINDKYLLSATIASFFLIFLVICTFLIAHSSHRPSFTGSSMQLTFSVLYDNYLANYPKREEHILNCTSSNMIISCPISHPPKSKGGQDFSSNVKCPRYFRWIHEDLKPWKEKGIQQQMIENLKDEAHFRLVIVNGTGYVKQYAKSPHSRDVFTLWGILQLLKLYPGRVPDLDLMFQCNDLPSIKRDKYPMEQSASAPPLFHYCADESTFDIIFPDWSFWGSPEINIKPWVSLVKDLEEGNSMKNWTAREPVAHWKGNIYNGGRSKLAECFSMMDWNAEISHQSWSKEIREGFKDSDLSKQCVHRYKLSIEGFSWSISEKYILACDSMTLRVNPIYYDFFSRSLIPMKHYWPINSRNLCKSIKFAVDWGNKNTNKAQEIGKAGSDYIFKQVKMEHVYDYMFHVLNEYAKLLRYKPTVPDGAVKLCSEKLTCSEMFPETKYKMESMVNDPAKDGPCILPTPYDSNTLQTLRDHEAKIKEVVEIWEDQSG